MNKGPLSSLKVMDFTTMLPGPFATMYLADLGADVIHVERADQEDPIRSVPPLIKGQSAAYDMLNRSKRSIMVDLKTPYGIQIIKSLVKEYDIIIEQFRPGVMDRLGLGYDTLKQINPKLIYCALTGYGQTGELKDRAGHDINYLARSGIANQMGKKKNPWPIQAADVGGGSFHALVGILSAVIHREKTGEGQLVDVSMTDGAMALNALNIAHYLATDENPKRDSGILDGGTFYDYYETLDGEYLSVGSLEPKFWKGFCEAIDHPELIEKGLRTPPGYQGEIKEVIAAAIRSKDLSSWVAIFEKKDVCVEPVMDIRKVVHNQHTLDRGMIVNVPDGKGGHQKQVAQPIKFSISNAQYRFTGTRAGAHTREILAGLK